MITSKMLKVSLNNLKHKQR